MRTLRHVSLDKLAVRMKNIWSIFGNIKHTKPDTKKQKKRDSQQISFCFKSKEQHKLHAAFIENILIKNICKNWKFTLIN